MLRRLFYVGLALLFGSAAAGIASPGRAYLTDLRTARAVSLVSPRASLAECLSELSRVPEVGIDLTAAPELGSEQLTAYVPKRPLRETMGALEELFDAAWVPSPGTAPAYHLTPDPVRARVQVATRAVLLRSLQKVLDDQAAEALKEAKGGALASETQRSNRMGLLLWSHLKPAEKLRVLQGFPTTISIPESQAADTYQSLVAAARLGLSTIEDRPLAGPLLASFDLEDLADRGLPQLRARATALRENSIVGAISLIEFFRGAAAPRPEQIDPPKDTPLLPQTIGNNGRIYGTRDELVARVGEACGVPILSRHRAYGGTASVSLGGRTLGQAMTEMAGYCEATLTANARGYQLLRSTTEAYDSLALPSSGPVQNYLKQRPKEGDWVTLEQLMELSSMTSLQLSVLQRSNLCDNEATFVREAYAVVRFYRSLTPEQRRLLFSEAGVEVASLTHAQLHQLLDAKAKRADWDIHEHVQQVRGLRFMFRNLERRNETVLEMRAIRGSRLVSPASTELPRVELEERPTASR